MSRIFLTEDDIVEFDSIVFVDGIDSVSSGVEGDDTGQWNGNNEFISEFLIQKDIDEISDSEGGSRVHDEAYLCFVELSLGVWTRRDV